MRKTIKLTTAALTALMAASTLSTTVFAAATPQAAKSTADATIAAGDDTNPTKPIIPDDPDTPGTGNKGPLSIDAVTSIHFGEISVKNAGKAMPATNDKPIVLQTTDNRATGEGWAVYVQYGTIDGTDDTKAAAPTDGDWVASDGTVGKGFKLSYPVIDYSTDVADSGTETAHNVGTAPSGSAVEISDAPTLIANAPNTTGMGTWVGSFDKAKTTLTVPATAVKGAYTANLVWTMAAAPQA